MAGWQLSFWSIATPIWLTFNILARTYLYQRSTQNNKQPCNTEENCCIEFQFSLSSMRTFDHFHPPRIPSNRFNQNSDHRQRRRAIPLRILRRTLEPIILSESRGPSTNATAFVEVQQAREEERPHDGEQMEGNKNDSSRWDREAGTSYPSSRQYLRSLRRGTVAVRRRQKQRENGRAEEERDKKKKVGAGRWRGASIRASSGQGEGSSRIRPRKTRNRDEVEGAARAGEERGRTGSRKGAKRCGRCRKNIDDRWTPGMLFMKIPDGDREIEFHRTRSWWDPALIIDRRPRFFFVQPPLIGFRTSSKLRTSIFDRDSLGAEQLET